MARAIGDARSARSADRGLRLAGCLGLLLWSALLWMPTGEASAGREQQMLAGHDLRTLSGETTRLVQEGGVTVVHFWATWCAPCRKELPLLDEVRARYAEHGVRFAAISVDTDSAKLRRFLEEVPVQLPVYIDGPQGLAQVFDLPSLPYTVVLDASGNAVLHTAQSGASAMKAISQSIDRTLAQAASGARGK